MKGQNMKIKNALSKQKLAFHKGNVLLSHTNFWQIKTIKAASASS